MKGGRGLPERCSVWDKLGIGKLDTSMFIFNFFIFFGAFC